MSDYKKLLYKIGCNIDNRNCMLRSYNEYTSLSDLKQFSSDILNQHEIGKKKKKYWNIVQINTPMEDSVVEVRK